MNSVQNVHELAFVFMDPFDLDIEDWVFVDHYLQVLPNSIGQPVLVVLLNLPPPFLKVFVINLRFQFPQLGEFKHSELVAFFIVQLRQFSICANDPSSGGHAIRLILKFLWVHIIEITEKVLLNDFSMNFCYSVYAMWSNYALSIKKQWTWFTKWAILTDFGGPSSIIESLLILSWSPGYCCSTFFRKKKFTK